MGGNTPNRGLPFPAPGDLPDVPQWVQDLAEAIDLDLSLVQGAPGQNRPPAGTPGRVFRHGDTGAVSLDVGTAWLDIATGGPYLSLNGGTLAGALDLADQQLVRPELRDLSETLVTVAASSANRTLDLAAANAWDVTLDVDCTISVSNPPAGARAGQFTLWLTQPATLRAVTWPASFRWAGGEPPIMATAKTYLLLGTYRPAVGLWSVASAGEYATA